MFGIGSIIEKVSDGLGLPEWFGDVAAGVGDFCTGNWPAVIEDGLDLLPNVARGLGQDELAGVLEYADDAYGLATGGSLDQLMSGKSEDILKLLGNMENGPLKDKLGDTNNMLKLLSFLTSDKKDPAALAALFGSDPAATGGSGKAGGGVQLTDLLSLVRA